MATEDDLFWLAWLESPTGKPSYPDFFLETYQTTPSNGVWVYIGPNALERARHDVRIIKDDKGYDGSRIIAAIDPKQINPNAYKWEIEGMEVLIIAEKEVPDIQIKMTAEVLLRNAASVVRALRVGGTIETFR